MTHLEALEIVSRQRDASRLGKLCADDNRNIHQRDAYRALVIGLALGLLPEQTDGVSRPPESVEVPSYPSFAHQAWNASKAAAGFAASGFALVSQEEYSRRLAICQAPCEHYEAGQGRCLKCGCSTSLKSRLASSHCPISKW